MSCRLGMVPGVCASVLICLLVSGVSAAEPDLGARVRAHLQAGEFGPAQAAAAAAEGAQRDQMLREIAMAQAAAGARRGAVQTAGSMSNDVARSGALDMIGAQPLGGGLPLGGAAMADFDSLMNLIVSTVEPESWEELGGPGAIEAFPGGVFVDSSGTLKRLDFETAAVGLDELRQASARSSSGNRDVRSSSPLRKVSLTRLEKQLQMQRALARHPDEAMKTLAGLHKVQYIFVYPESGDIVLAGPAGDWQPGPEGRLVNVESGRPVLHLDDLVVALRNALHQDGRFGCSITPSQEALAQTQAFLSESAKQPLRPGQRAAWLEQLREQVGQQKIEVYGIDPRSHAGRVIVEADYRMKLVGMGLEDGTFGVTNYLDSIEVAPGQSPPPMDVLRWWFTLNYDAVQATQNRDAFQLQGQGVKVLSENELLTQQGQRVHTGKSDLLNQQFARSFTKHFEQLAAKYPIYAELQNVFDLALVAAVIKAEDLPGQVGWHLTHFDNPEKYQLELAPAPEQVDTVINHRVVDRKHIIAGVSGGVAVDASQLVTGQAIAADSYGLLKAEHQGAAPSGLPDDAWWWD